MIPTLNIRRFSDDPSSSVYFYTNLKDVARHIRLKHPETHTFFEHVVYPESFALVGCKYVACSVAAVGLFLAHDETVMGEHMVERHDKKNLKAAFNIFCRLCEQVRTRYYVVGLT